jgi:hypothetical protein
MNAGGARSVNERAQAEVAVELERHGITDVRQAREMNRRVLKGEAPNGRTLTFIVKSKTSGTWQASTNDGDPEKSSSNFYWVFVDLGSRPNPSFFVVPDRWIREDIREHHDEYLAKHGGARAMGGASTHHAIQPRRIEEWRDRWDLLGFARSW